MTDTLIDLLGFSLKTLVVFIIIALLLSIVIGIIKSARDPELSEESSKESYRFTDLKQKIYERKELAEKELKLMAADPAEREKLKKQMSSKKFRQKQSETQKEFYEKQLSQIKELESRNIFCPQNLFLLDFDGDIKGSNVAQLRREIDLITDVATEKDEVVIRLTSPGGMVNSYGLCAAQLMRLRDKGIYLTVCVDSVAASGGYMMAAVANKIVAAPFSYIGSIGVVASIPNFNRLMDDHKVDYEQITAGKYKRTVTMFGKNTDEARAKLKEELEAIHKRFKEEIATFRPQLDIEQFATGEHWLATDAKERGLVDEIETSDSYLERRISQTHKCAVQIKWKVNEKKSLMGRLKKFLTVRTWVKSIKKMLSENDWQQNINIK